MALSGLYLPALNLEHLFMRISCLKENLSAGLAIVSRAVASRTTLPITQNVLLATDDGRLKLATTNLEIAVSTWIGAQIGEEGAITVPARLLTEFVNSLPSEKIDIVSSSEPLGINLNASRVDGSINGIDASEFPPIPTVESGITVKISPDVLRKAVNSVAFAAATEDSRPVLTGVMVEIEADKFTFASADGFRLAVYKGNLLEPVDENISFLVPAKALQEVSRLIDSPMEQVEFTITPAKSQVLFKIKDVELVSQLVQGAFPNYSQLLPEKYDTKAIVNVKEFLAATRTSSVFARDGSGIVRLNLSSGTDDSPGTLSIVSKSEEVGSNQGDIDATIEGQENRIAFNSRYVMQVLDVLDNDSVAIEMTTSSSPGVLKPIGDDQYVHVIMPMFVQW